MVIPVTALAVLKLNAGGMPLEMIDIRKAATLQCEGRVLYSFGANPIILRGGINDHGVRSVLALDPIVAVKDRSGTWGDQEQMTITRRELFARDRMCLYCGGELTLRTFTVDHIVPRSRGGALRDPANLAASCAGCNARKGDRLLSESEMQLIAVPYRPNPAARIILSGRRIHADQMEYLLRFSNAPPS